MFHSVTNAGVSKDLAVTTFLPLHNVKLPTDLAEVLKFVLLTRGYSPAF